MPTSPPNHHRPYRHWGTSLLRKLIASVVCGTSPSPSPRRRHTKQPHPPQDSESGSVRLSDLFKLPLHLIPDDTVLIGKPSESSKKAEMFEEFSEAVRLLRSDGVEERRNGAKMVRRLAKEDSEARVSLAMMGAIPTLVQMIDKDEDDDDFSVDALYALLNLGIANDMNKAAIVQAGAVHKMLKMINSSNVSPDSSVSDAVVANFLALSACDTNKSIIGSSGAIPFLAGIAKESDRKCSYQAKQDSLRALYNLSILPLNIPLILETDMIRFLMISLGVMELSERSLAILSNVVAVPEGRKALSAVPDSFPILIDALSWNDSTECQEKAAYVLMVMAHKSYNDRHAMIEAGVVSALLELTLIGSTLAQKRASRILACLRVDKGKSVRDGAVSAPIHGGPSSSSSSLSVGRGVKEEEGAMSEERRAVKQMVQQSLQNNMRKMASRANLPQDFVPSEHLKSLSTSSTSKSLPF